MKTKVCCFIGHRKINETVELVDRLSELIKELIVNEKVETFLFGSRGRFNRLCYELVSMNKEKYPNIKRIYIRAEYPYISESYKKILLTEYEETYYPSRILGAGKAVYLERNEEMILKSDICIFYYHESADRRSGRSGTKAAYEFAANHNKRIITV